MGLLPINDGPQSKKLTLDRGMEDYGLAVNITLNYANGIPTIGRPRVETDPLPYDSPIYYYIDFSSRREMENKESYTLIIDVDVYATAEGDYEIPVHILDPQFNTTSDLVYNLTIIRPPTPNEPPNSEINGPYSGEAGVSISFSSEESSDSDGSIVEYYWTFGDGAHSYSTNPTYTYQSPGTYTITLRVTDDDGATDATSTACTVESPPQPEPDKPGGIPGFDFASILISLMISILAMWKMSRRMSCANQLN